MRSANYFGKQFKYIIFMLLLMLFILEACAGSGKVDDGKNPSAFAEEARIMFINAGRADSILIQIDGKSYLIDAGEDSSVPAIYAALEYCGVNKLDGVFLTHTHSDHIGGFDAVAMKYKIDKIYSAEISENKKDGTNKIAKLAEKHSIPHVKLKAGDQVDVTDSVYFKVLGPLVYNQDDDNDNSLVLRLDVNRRTFLFTGDMQFAEEKTLLEAKIDLSADVLKVGNHGNPDATSKEFAKAVSPDIAVFTTDISLDANSANPKVMENLSGAKFYITENYRLGLLMELDKSGFIKISDPVPAEKEADLEITEVSMDKQLLTIVNRGDTVNISGYFIYSTKGSEIFIFPEGSMINAGGRITVGVVGSGADFTWDEKNVWNKKNEDIAMLYDKYGNLLSSKNAS